MGLLQRIKGIRKRWIAVAAAVTAVGVLVVSRPHRQESVVTVDFDPDSVPTMFTRDALSYVSDSGYVKYLIKAPVWYMYNEASEPNWKFNEGLYCEQYDRDMKVVATFVADSAVYLSQKKLWEFIGNVRMNNVSRDRFATQLLFWDERNRRIYSDSFIHIEKSDRIIEGYGFESDDRIESYTVNRPTMIIPVSDFNRRPQPEDSVHQAPAPAPAPPAADRPEKPKLSRRAESLPAMTDEQMLAPVSKASMMAPPAR